jgi:hypothetical protein
MSDWDWRAWSASIATMTERPVKITFEEMRDSGVRGILIYSADYQRSHSIAIEFRTSGPPIALKSRAARASHFQLPLPTKQTEAMAYQL